GPRRPPPRDLTTHHRDAPPTMKRCDVGLMRTAPTHARHIAERDPVGAARAGEGRTVHVYRTAGWPLPRPGATSPNTVWVYTLRSCVPVIAPTRGSARRSSTAPSSPAPCWVRSSSPHDWASPALLCAKPSPAWSPTAWPRPPAAADSSSP